MLILVRATPHPDPALAGKKRVTKEGATRRYITEKEWCEVERSPYYIRLMNNGDLESKIEETKPASISKKKSTPKFDTSEDQS